LFKIFVIIVIACRFLAAEAKDSAQKAATPINIDSHCCRKLSPLLLRKISGKNLHDTLEVRILFSHFVPFDTAHGDKKPTFDQYLQDFAIDGLKEVRGKLGREISISGSHTSGYSMRVSISEIRILESVESIFHIGPVFRIAPELHISRPLKKGN
jgi:hypothetical protein